MRSKIVNDILKSTPLDIRIKVDVKMMLLTVLTDLGFRESRSWTDSEEDQKILDKIEELTKKNTNYILDSIKEWEADGRPK